MRQAFEEAGFNTRVRNMLRGIMLRLGYPVRAVKPIRQAPPLHLKPQIPRKFIINAYQEGRVACLEDLSERGGSDPCFGESYYWNPYVRPHTWGQPEIWSNEARLWAMGWLECDEEERKELHRD